MGSVYVLIRKADVPYEHHFREKNILTVDHIFEKIFSLHTFKNFKISVLRSPTIHVMPLRLVNKLVQYNQFNKTFLNN